MTIISLDTLLIRNQKLFAAEIDDDLVMLDATTSTYYAFNPVARKIWELLADAMTCTQLIQALMLRYVVDYERCKVEVESLLAQQLQNGLIQLAKP